MDLYERILQRPLVTPEKKKVRIKKLKSGAFTTTLDLETGREYQFRYLLDKKIWENERDADKSTPTPYGDSENSVIVI